MKRLFFFILLLLISLSVSCNRSNSKVEEFSTPSEPTGTSTDASADLPPGLSEFNDTVHIAIDGDQIILESTAVPNHPSPYFGQGKDGYIAPHDGMVVNPNLIQEQELSFRIPRYPQLAAAPSETDLGPIGMSVNGVALFNQYAGRTAQGWTALDREIATFDIYNGHPQQTGMYHHHLEPLYITQDDPTVLVGFLLDGFPVYGPQDQDGSQPADLDECNGHFGTTPHHAGGTYHYHTTTEEPYISGCYAGTPGDATN